MQGKENPSVETPCKMPVRWHRLLNVLNVRVAMLLVISACTATAAGIAVPASAEPTDPGAVPANSSNDRFVQSLDKIGIPYQGESDAVNSAITACRQIAEGHSIVEAVNGVRDANPALTLLQGAHFVAIARAIYCPGHREAF